VRASATMTGMRLLPATVEHLVALQSDSTAFGRLIGSPVPDGWPEFPESIVFTLDRLREQPDEGDWWMHFFLADDALVGSGGFVGPPQDNPSTGVLRRLGFTWARELVDPDDGPLWRWELALTAY
jgi:[ribosomal protein S5]-alanine N-acetyltransferase